MITNPRVINEYVEMLENIDIAEKQILDVSFCVFILFSILNFLSNLLVKN
jgi:hypothetical protein